jgi:ParB-like chromosome segregation protein Spo0J
MKNLKTIDIQCIFENTENPRIIKTEKFKKLVKSIKEFPEMLQLRPIIVNSEMVILGGNMRLKACKEAGLEKVPIIIADNLTKEQEKEFVIKDNLGYGEWDYDLLSQKWEIELLIDWGIDLPKMDEEISPSEEDIKENEYLIIIECSGELEQKKLFEELENRGLKCKLMG